MYLPFGRPARYDRRPNLTLGALCRIGMGALVAAVGRERRLSRMAQQRRDVVGPHLPRHGHQQPELPKAPDSLGLHARVHARQRFFFTQILVVAAKGGGMHLPNAQIHQQQAAPGTRGGTANQSHSGCMRRTAPACRIPRLRRQQPHSGFCILNPLQCAQCGLAVTAAALDEAPGALAAPY